MNLLENYILEIISVTDVTKEYERGIRQFEPSYEAEEPRLQVVLKTDCYGTREIKKVIWKQSDFDKYKKDGFFLA